MYVVAQTDALQAGERDIRGVAHLGTVEGEGTADFDFLRMSVYECVLEIAGAFNLEIEQVLSLDGTGVASRSVSLLKQRGRDYGARFDYGREAPSSTRPLS